MVWSSSWRTDVDTIRLWGWLIGWLGSEGREREREYISLISLSKRGSSIYLSNFHPSTPPFLTMHTHFPSPKHNTPMIVYTTNSTHPLKHVATVCGPHPTLQTPCNTTYMHARIHITEAHSLYTPNTHHILQPHYYNLLTKSAIYTPRHYHMQLPHDHCIFMRWNPPASLISNWGSP